MLHMKVKTIAAVIAATAGLGGTGLAHAVIVSYTSSAAFQAALTGQTVITEGYELPAINSTIANGGSLNGLTYSFSNGAPGRIDNIYNNFGDQSLASANFTNGYFLHARMLDNWGLSRLGKVFHDISIDEMRDSDKLISRILMFDGHPNLQKLNAIQVGENAEEMLRLALDGEKAAVAQFNASAQECHAIGDHGTASVFEEMVRDEETHADWFEGQIDALERVGIQQYLAQQIDAGAGPG